MNQKKMGMQEQAIKCKISKTLLTGSVKSLGYSQLLEFQEFWNMDGFSKISAGNEFYAHIRYIQLIKLALLILLFTTLKSHVEYYLQATACMTKKYQYLKHTDKFDLKFSIEQWMGGAVRLSYIYTGQNKKHVPLEDKWYYWMKMQQKSHIYK